MTLKQCVTLAQGVHAPHTYCRRMNARMCPVHTHVYACACIYDERIRTYWCGAVYVACVHTNLHVTHIAHTFKQGLPEHYSHRVYTYARMHMQNCARACISMHAYAHSQNIHMHTHMHMHTSSGATRHGSRPSYRAQPETEPTLASFPDAAPRCTLILTQSVAAPPLPKHTWREPGVSFFFCSRRGAGILVS